jgi:hypothetical protein
MEIRLAEIKKIEGSLNKLVTKDIKIKLAYKIGKLLKVLNEELKSLENARINLVKKYGKKEEGSEDVRVPIEKTEEFMLEFNGLMQEKITVDFEPIPYQEFGDISLSVTDILSLDGYIIKSEE